MKKTMTIPFALENFRIPIANMGSDEGGELFALVDTGAQTCVLDKDIHRDHPQLAGPLRKIGTSNLLGAGGEEVTGFVRTRLHLAPGNEGDWEIDALFRCPVADLSNLNDLLLRDFGFPGKVSMILGSDMLSWLGATIDYRRRTVTLRRPPRTTEPPSLADGGSGGDGARSDAAPGTGEPASGASEG